MKDEKKSEIIPQDSTEENIMEKEKKTTKANKKFNIGKIILIILLIILIYIVLSTGRKMIILNNLSKNVLTYINSSNAYVKIFGDLTNGYEYIEMYKKEDTIKNFSKMNEKDVFITTIETPNEFKYYIDTPEYKKLRVVNDGIHQKEIIENPIFYYGTFGDKVVIAMFTKIDTDKVNGTDCYVLSSFDTSAFSNCYGTYEGKSYVEKDTGLLIKKTTLRDEKECVTNYEYKFNENTDKDMEEPDSSQYEIEE